MVFLANADYDKYGGFMKDLKTARSNKKDEYPKELSGAYDILDDYRWDNTPKKSSGCGKPPRSTQSSNTTSDGTPATSFAQTKTLKPCYIDGKMHPYNECKLRDVIPKAEWWINTAAGRKYKEATEGFNAHVQAIMEGRDDTGSQNTPPTTAGGST